MRCFLWTVGFFSMGAACCYGSPGDVELKLARGVTHVDNLAFSVTYEAGSDRVFCNSMAVSSSDADDSSRDDWDWVVETSKPLPCPNPFKWGQDFGEGWEVKAGPLPLERNRSYWIMLTSSYDGKAYMGFCVFKNGTIVAHSYSFREPNPGSKEDIVRCQEEGRQDAAAPQTE